MGKGGNKGRCNKGLLYTSSRDSQVIYFVLMSCHHNEQTKNKDLDRLYGSILPVEGRVCTKLGKRVRHGWSCK